MAVTAQLFVVMIYAFSAIFLNTGGIIASRATSGTKNLVKIKLAVIMALKSCQNAAATCSKTLFRSEVNSKSV